MPLIVHQLYFLITKAHVADTTRTVIEYLFGAIAIATNYSYQCTNFYVYYICFAIH